MNTGTMTRRSPGGIALYVLAYALWIVTILMTVQAVLQVRMAANAVSAAGGIDRYTLSLIDQVCLLIGGFIGFVYVMYIEHLYRDGVTLRIQGHGPDGPASPPLPLPKGGVMRLLATWNVDILLERFALTFAIPLAVYLLALAVQYLAVGALVPAI